MFARAHAAFERLLEAVVMLLMLALAVEVSIGVVYRMLGESLVWYDEIAAVLLAWLTYYGSALAAMKRAHIGVSALVDALPAGLRTAAVLFAETCVIGFFALLAWTSWNVMDVLATDYLVSLPAVPVNYTQSVIWISSVLFIIAEIFMLPQLLNGAPQAEALAPAAQADA